MSISQMSPCQNVPMPKCCVQRCSCAEIFPSWKVPMSKCSHVEMSIWRNVRSTKWCTCQNILIMPKWLLPKSQVPKWWEALFKNVLSNSEKTVCYPIPPPLSPFLNSSVNLLRSARICKVSKVQFSQFILNYMIHWDVHSTKHKQLAFE